MKQKKLILLFLLAIVLPNMSISSDLKENENLRNEKKIDIYFQSLEYHKKLPAGKMQVVLSKPLKTQQDLALAYTPGVAAASKAIAKNPEEAMYLTNRGNLVAVISNGTAVLGLGNIGALAAKPVMEGKAALFKKFAGINCYDIEINEKNPEKLVDIIIALEPTFGAINLEDIKAPECFYIEKRLKEHLNIPVLHDDQHGTAIVVSAAILNGLKLAKKNISDIKMVVSGAGAAGIACLDLLTILGLKKENLIVLDSQGIIYKNRSDNMDPNKLKYASTTSHRTLSDAINKADVFLGLSVPKVLTEEMVKKMAHKPLILALANPEPEILPELVHKVRCDAIVATGRSDYPNQVNNALIFPYLFRAALDVRASNINEEMKMAAIMALTAHVEEKDNHILENFYGNQNFNFGPDYILPKLLDPRLIIVITPKVAEAAMKSGVAKRPIQDMEAYKEYLSSFIEN